MEVLAEARGPGEDNVCCKLVRSLYGTRDAALNWSPNYMRALEGMGFVKGASSTCTSWHPVRCIAPAVHGDDCVSEGELDDLKWMGRQPKSHVQLKTEIIGAHKFGKGGNVDKPYHALETWRPALGAGP